MRKKQGSLFGPSSTLRTLWISLGVVVLMVVILCTIPDVGVLGYIWLIAAALVAVYSAFELLREKRSAEKKNAAEKENPHV